MSDDLGLFGDPSTATHGGSRRSERQAHERRRREQRRRRVVLGSTLALLMVIAGGVWLGMQQLLELREVPDHPGPGVGDTVVRVEQGDSTSAIAARLESEGVVASARAFTAAAEDDPRIRSVQPGYYQMRHQMSGASAVAMLLDPASRVGRLEVRAGMQLDDVTQPGGISRPGILSLLSKASCARIDGDRSCVSVAELRATMGQSQPVELGVPEWAAAAVSRVDPAKRLEGLVMPGHYDVRPGSTAEELLAQLMATSSARLSALGMPDAAYPTGFQPYEVLIIASIIEKEAIAADFGQVSRVIFNRLAVGMPLQMDSTINYPLDRQEITTSDADRGRPGAYNTYLNVGLPPSPVGSPGAGALAAAIEPPPGPWRYFVKCQTDGTSCFSVTVEEHRAAVADARARGIF